MYTARAILPTILAWCGFPFFRRSSFKVWNCSICHFKIQNWQPHLSLSRNTPASHQYERLLYCLHNNYSMSPSWIWSDKITNERVARVGYNQNLAHYFPYDVKLPLLAHSRRFLANQKARNAIVGAENLLKSYSLSHVAALVRSHMNGLKAFERTIEQTTETCLLAPDNNSCSNDEK